MISLSLLGFVSTCFRVGLLSAFLGGITTFLALEYDLNGALGLLLSSGISFLSYLMFLRGQNIDWDSYRQISWSASWVMGLWAKKLSLWLGWATACFGQFICGAYLWFERPLISDHKWLGITAILAILIVIQGLINRFTNLSGGFIFFLVILAHYLSFTNFRWVGVFTHFIATIILIVIVTLILEKRISTKFTEEEFTKERECQVCGTIFTLQGEGGTAGRDTVKDLAKSDGFFFDLNTTYIIAGQCRKCYSEVYSEVLQNAFEKVKFEGKCSVCGKEIGFWDKRRGYIRCEQHRRGTLK